MRKVKKGSGAPINRAQQGRKMPGGLPRKSGPASGAAYKGRNLDKPMQGKRRRMEDMEV
jgi:hypothetical protein